MNTCNICNKTFKSSAALAGHKRMHGQSNGLISMTMCSCIITKKTMPVQCLIKYQKSLIPCKFCSTVFKPSQSKKYFCSHSCSASFNNSKRSPRSIESRQKTSNSVKNYINFHKPFTTKSNKKEIVGPFSSLFVCSCKHCKTKFVSRIKKQYCLDHKDLYSVSNKAGYKFTFNVFHYPDLFDLNLIKSIGWFSPGGKAGKWNIRGISRDHKISVTEAIANNYDPYYITHPINCELMEHSENNKKKTKSSLTYTELVWLVTEYDNKSNLLPSVGTIHGPNA